jgi:hypothetical protein
MAQDGSRIPAWRRLGLALQSEAQPAASATDSTASLDSTPQGRPAAVQDSVNSPVEPAQDGKSSKLGKRKHEAEDEDQAPKKSKQSHGVAAASTVPAALDQAPVESAPEETSAPKSGDPNYRQKKTGDPNYRNKKAKPTERKKKEPKKSAPSPAESIPTRTRATLLTSTEVDHLTSAPFSTPQKQHQPIIRYSSKDSSGSPGHRKSVAFTPDTKTVDGDSGQTWFKKWAAEQKGEEIEAPKPLNLTKPTVSTEELNKVRELTEATKVEKKDKKDKKKSQEKETKPATPEKSSTTTATTAAAKTSAAPQGKKKDPSIYIDYLKQYYNDHDNWKFNKAKQNDVVDNALNIFRIPNEHEEALLEYIKGLKGAGVIERLQEKCRSTIDEIDKEDAKNPTNMDVEAQEAAKEAALQERVTKEKKRRKVDGDIEALGNHPHGDAYIRRMRRKRAVEVLTALARAEPIIPVRAPTTSINPMAANLQPQKNIRKRKRRGDISSDESSSDSSSSESESSSSESESESDSDDSSDDSSSSGSDSDAKPAAKKAKTGGNESESSDSDSDSGSEGSDEKDSDSDSDSD